MPSTVFTTVTATPVKDAAGNPYVGGTYNINFVNPSTGLPTVGGYTIAPSEVSGTLDASGNLSIQLLDNSQVSPSGSQWRFSICNSAGTICFSTNISISGTSQDITSTLQAAAASLGTTSAGTVNGSLDIKGPYPWYDVRAYGAIGDGVTDDTVAVQTAVAAACAATYARVVYFPAGRYKLTMPVSGVMFPVSASGVTFIGAGGFRNGLSPDAGGAQLYIYGSAGDVIRVGIEKKVTITSIARSGNTVTANFTALGTGGGSFSTGSTRQVTVAGCSDATFNGTFTPTAATSTQLQWTQAAADASSSGGTVTEVYNAAAYDGLEGFCMENIQAVYAGASTSALTNGFGNYGTNVYFMRDWRGGDQNWNKVTVNNFHYGFWGIQSDINHFKDVQFRQCEVGMYLGPRSDQNDIDSLYALHNDNTVTIDGATLTKFWGGIDNSSGSSSTSSFSLLGTYTGSPTASTIFNQFWFENSQGQTATAINSFIDIGNGVSVQVVDTYLHNCFIIDRQSPNTPRTKYLVSMDNGEGLFISRAQGQAIDSLIEFKGTTSPFRVRIEQDRLQITTPYVNNGSGTPQVLFINQYSAANSLLLRNFADVGFDALRLQAGASTNQSCKVRWMGIDGNSRFYDELSAALNRNIVDVPANQNRLALVLGGTSGLNSVGANADRFNVDNPSGTSGSAFGDGAGNVTATISSAGIGTFNGGLKVASTGTTVKQMQLFTAVAVDPGSIPATSRGSIAVTIAGTPGIAVGDIIIPVQGINGINDDLLFEGVTATGANQISLFFYNPTAGAIDDTSHNWDFLWLDVT